MNRTRESGATLIEMLIVVAIISILANLAIPGVQYALKRAQAVAVVGDFKVVEQAVIEYYRDEGELPRNRGVRREPRELRPYLDGRVDWNKARYKLDWENWSGRRRARRYGMNAGLAIRTPDTELLGMIQQVYDGPLVRCNSSRRWGQCYAFVIDPNGNPLPNRRNRRNRRNRNN